MIHFNLFKQRWVTYYCILFLYLSLSVYFTYNLVTDYFNFRTVSIQTKWYLRFSRVYSQMKLSFSDTVGNEKFISFINDHGCKDTETLRSCKYKISSLIRTACPRVMLLIIVIVSSLQRSWTRGAGHSGLRLGQTSQRLLQSWQRGPPGNCMPMFLRRLQRRNTTDIQFINNVIRFICWRNCLKK